MMQYTLLFNTSSVKIIPRKLLYFQQSSKHTFGLEWIHKFNSFPIHSVSSGRCLQFPHLGVVITVPTAIPTWGGCRDGTSRFSQPSQALIKLRSFLHFAIEGAWYKWVIRLHTNGKIFRRLGLHMPRLGWHMQRFFADWRDMSAHWGDTPTDFSLIGAISGKI